MNINIYVRTRVLFIAQNIVNAVQRFKQFLGKEHDYVSNYQSAVTFAVINWISNLIYFCSLSINYRENIYCNKPVLIVVFAIALLLTKDIIYALLCKRDVYKRQHLYCRLLKYNNLPFSVLITICLDRVLCSLPRLTFIL